MRLFSPGVPTLSFFLHNGPDSAMKRQPLYATYYLTSLQMEGLVLYDENDNFVERELSSLTRACK